MVSDSLNGLTSHVIGAAIRVHQELGPGFLESIYEEALALELAESGILYERQKIIHVTCRGHAIGEGRVDLFVDRRLVVELKAVEKLMPIHTAQVISYLKTMGQPLGLLINFNERLLKNGIRRVIYD